MASLQLEVVCPRGTIVKSDVDEVTVPGALGEFGILPGHIPVLSALRTGQMRYRVGDKVEHLALGGGGYVEIGANDRIMVLSDQSAKADEVDREAVRSELAEAESELAHFTGNPESAEFKRIKQQVEWARARLELPQ